MQQLRVIDLAHTMGISSKELIFKLRSIGVTVDSDQDALDLATVRAIITGETLQRRPREVILRREQKQKEPQSASARERLARRRRRQLVETDHEIKEVAPAPRTRVRPDEIKEATTAAGETPVPEIPENAVESPVTEEISEQETGKAAVEVPASPEEIPATEQTDAPVEAEALPEDEAEHVEEETPKIETATDEEIPFEPTPIVDKSTSEEPEEEVKPEPKVSEEEFKTRRPEEDSPKRVKVPRAKTPLERSLRVLSPEEIKQRLQDQKLAEKKRREEKTQARAKGPGGRKAKAAADAREIRELLNKFEEQRIKGQTDGPAPSGAKPGGGRQRPGGGQRVSKKARKRQQKLEAERRPAPPRPVRGVEFKDGKKPDGPIVLSEMVTARELAEKLNITAKALLGLLIQRGMMVTTNQSLPHELAEEICAELGVDAMVASAEDLVEFEQEESQEDLGPMVARPPVVTVMGHVDHGKTSLLDSLRSSRVAEQEAGGITQHVGASKITTEDGKVVVFVDTPGHEAFTQMRARGAQVTDIVVLVVAADDGVMPQTREAINHARAAKVPLIVALNKIDKANANPERVKQQLSEVEVLVEDWGGDVPCVPVSAKTGQGIKELLDMILLVAEIKEFKAPVQGRARGIVLEARKEKGRGLVATIVIKQGTLRVGDAFFCGSIWGRVRAMADDLGKPVKEAGPSDAVEVMGFSSLPNAGDILQVVEKEERAQEIASFRSQKEREEGFAASRKVSLENLFDQIEAGEQKGLNVVIKADVQGSAEVLREAMNALSTDEVKIHVLQSSVGAITTNDVMLASASSAIIIGFNVRPERTARELAETEKVDIRLYSVIYNLIDDIKKAMVGLLEPEFEEEFLGQAEVREVFRVPKIGAIAGCHVIEGVINRSSKARLLRDNVVIYDGSISSLRRFKEDVSEVRTGFECGISLERYQDIKVGDVIEVYRMKEIERTL